MLHPARLFFRDDWEAMTDDGRFIYLDLPGTVMVPESIVLCEELSNGLRTLHIDGVTWNVDCKCFDLMVRGLTTAVTKADVMWFCWEGVLQPEELEAAKRGELIPHDGMEAKQANRRRSILPRELVRHV